STAPARAWAEGRRLHGARRRKTAIDRGLLRGRASREGRAPLRVAGRQRPGRRDGTLRRQAPLRGRHGRLGVAFPQSQQLVLDSKAIARKIVDSLGPSDLAAIVLTRDTRFFPDFTNNRSKLIGSINEFKPPGEAERMELEWLTKGHIGGLPALLDV